jgi:hypothetical protein
MSSHFSERIVEQGFSNEGILKCLQFYLSKQSKSIYKHNVVCDKGKKVVRNIIFLDIIHLPVYLKHRPLYISKHSV